MLSFWLGGVGDVGVYSVLVFPILVAFGVFGMVWCDWLNGWCLVPFCGCWVRWFCV